MKSDYSIKPNAQFFTVLKREKARTAFIFVWSMQKWLTFDSAGRLSDIVYYGTGKTMAEALQIIKRDLPGCRSVVRYCPRSTTCDRADLA